MSNTFSRLMLALVLLGFLASTTMNMYGDLQQLKDENQKLSQELTQLRSNYGAVEQERNAMQAENADVHRQLDAFRNAYLSENQARLKAESDAANYKGMILNMAKNIQVVPPTVCLPAKQSAKRPEELLFSSIIPIGTGSLITLAMIGLVVALINHSRKQKKLRNFQTPVKKLR